MTDKVHTVRGFSMYTDAKGGGLIDIAHVELQGFTLIDNKDLARLRHHASVLEAEPIPAHILEVLEMCLTALRPARGSRMPKKVAASEAVEAIRNLLKAAPITREGP